jgi:cytochrome c peroxidase
MSGRAINSHPTVAADGAGTDAPATRRKVKCLVALVAACLPIATPVLIAAGEEQSRRIGREVSTLRHLSDDQEFATPLQTLIEFGKQLFTANWTDEEGAGRPLIKGNGRGLSDPSRPLNGTRRFNRLSGPDANSCTGCHNSPYGIPGGSGDFATSAFILGYRFDYLTLDPEDRVPTRGSRDETGNTVTVQTFANRRSTTGLFGAGYIEMLARQITSELQGIRESMRLGETRELRSKGISFGKLTRRKDGLWDVSAVEGIPRMSLVTVTSLDPPSLIIRPWSASGSAVSLREYTNSSFNQHLGIQSTERFGTGTDSDGDGVRNELTRADVTAVTLYQASLAVPGRLIPNDREIEAAVILGEARFIAIGCASCHIPQLPLDKQGWIFEEPNPYNAPTNLRRGEAKSLRMDLNDGVLPQPRLPMGKDGAVWVPAYTDLKLHDITGGPDDLGAEPLDMNYGTWSVNLAKGNRKFLTKRLWACANAPTHFHHGLFTTLRASVKAHSGEALDARQKFEQLPAGEQDAVIEFLKTLQALPPGTRSMIVDDKFRPREWPPAGKAAVR